MNRRKVNLPRIFWAREARLGLRAVGLGGLSAAIVFLLSALNSPASAGIVLPIQPADSSAVAARTLGHVMLHCDNKVDLSDVLAEMADRLDSAADGDSGMASGGLAGCGMSHAGGGTPGDDAPNPMPSRDSRDIARALALAMPSQSSSTMTGSGGIAGGGGSGGMTAATAGDSIHLQADCVSTRLFVANYLFAPAPPIFGMLRPPRP